MTTSQTVITPIPQTFTPSTRFVIKPKMGEQMLSGHLHDRMLNHKLDTVAMPPSKYQDVRDDLARFSPVPVTRVAMKYASHTYSGVIDSNGTPFLFALNSHGLLLQKAPETEQTWIVFEDLRDAEETSALAQRRQEATRPALIIKADKWTSAGAVVIDGKGRIALVAPKGQYGGHTWTFPKGKVEAGESLEEAAKQEVMEEAGVHVKLGDKLGEYPGSYSNTHFFMGELAGDAQDKMDEETEAVKWVTPDEAKTMLTHPRDLKVLGDVQKHMDEKVKQSGGKKPWGHISYYRVRGGKVQFIKQKGVAPAEVSPKVKLHAGEEASATPTVVPAAPSLSNIKLKAGQNDAETKEGLAAFEKTLEAVASVFDYHGANGGLTVSLNGNVMSGAYAQFSPSSNVITVKTTKGNYWNSFAHEYGHYIDYKLIGKNGGKRSNAVNAFIKKLKEHKAHKKLMATNAEFIAKPDYYGLETEVFARFFNEWMFSRLKAAGLNEPPHVPVKISYQSKSKREWDTSTDFPDLCSEFEALLTGEGIDWKPINGGLTSPKKTGEGSKGGVVIGHDKHGNPIYQSQVKEKTGKIVKVYEEDTTKPSGGGTQGGKWFKDSFGNYWYGKHYEGNEERIATEYIVNTLYEKLGLRAPTSRIETIDGKKYVLNKEVKGEQAKKASNCDDALQGFVIDAWLGNWDVIGATYDNIVVDSEGNAVRIDNGGSLRYRAQGKKKGTEGTAVFGDAVNEIDTMRTQGTAGKVFGKLKDYEIAAQIHTHFGDDLQDTLDAVTKTLDTAIGLTHEAKTEIKEKLVARAMWLRKWAETHNAKSPPLVIEPKKDEPAPKPAPIAPSGLAGLGGLLGGFAGIGAKFGAAPQKTVASEKDIVLTIPTKKEKEDAKEAAKQAKNPPKDAKGKPIDPTGTIHPYGPQEGAFEVSKLGVVFINPDKIKPFDKPGSHAVAQESPYPKKKAKLAFQMWKALHDAQPKSFEAAKNALKNALPDIFDFDDPAHLDDELANALDYLVETGGIIAKATEVKTYAKPTWWDSYAEKKFGAWDNAYGPIVEGYDAMPPKKTNGSYESHQWFRNLLDDAKAKAYGTSEMGEWKHESSSEYHAMQTESKGGLTQDEAKYGAKCINDWVGWPTRPYASHLRGVLSRMMGVKPEDEILNIRRAHAARHAETDEKVKMMQMSDEEFLSYIAKKSHLQWHDEEKFWDGYNGKEPPPNHAVANSIAKLAKAAQKAHEKDADADGMITVYRWVSPEIFDKDKGVVKHSALASWSTNPDLDFNKIRLTLKVPLKSVIFGWRGTPGTLSNEKEVWVASSTGKIKIHSWQYKGQYHKGENVISHDED